MILVTGGYASGRRDYVRSLGYADEDFSVSADGPHAVLDEACDLVRHAVEDPAQLADMLAATKRVVICREVGSGIVPLDADERAWRERAGELSRALAARAESVVRLTCGVPQVLQGPDPLAAGLPTSASFFQNRSCEYFPCHEGVDERDFNCLFCYCPLYALGPDCGGNFTYTEKGRKNCTGCIVPHVRENGAKIVAAHYEQLAELARE